MKFHVRGYPGATVEILVEGDVVAQLPPPGRTESPRKAAQRLMFFAPDMAHALELLVGEETEESACMTRKEKEDIARSALHRAKTSQPFE